MRITVKRRLWIIILTLTCVITALGIFCYPSLWRLYEYRSVCDLITAGDEDTIVTELRTLSRKGMFQPDWTPRAAWLRLHNSLNLPARKAYPDGNRDANGMTLLQRAAVRGQAKTLATLLNIGARVDCYGDEGFQALLDGVAGGNTNIIALLLAHGAKLNSSRNEMPFINYVALSCQTPGMVEFLIKAGADPNAGVSNGKTALDLARIYNTNLIPVLIANGAKAGKP